MNVTLSLCSDGDSLARTDQKLVGPKQNIGNCTTGIENLKELHYKCNVFHNFCFDHGIKTLS